MRRRNLDLAVASSIAILTIALTLLTVRVQVLQVLVALPLVFFLPGYLLTELLFRSKKVSPMPQVPSSSSQNTPRALDGWEYLTLSLGLSVAISIVGGFLLNLLPLGLAPTTWAALLGALTLVLSLVVAAQRVARRQQSPGNIVQPQTRVRFSFIQLLLFGLAGVIVVFSVLYSINSATQQSYPGFTQFWMLPPPQHATSCTVQLGVRNFEGVSVTYRVEMEVNSTPTKTWNAIDLTSQQTWSQSVPITLSAPATATVGTTPTPVSTISVDAQLYRMDKPSTIYRHVHILLPILGMSTDGKTFRCGTS
jgi:uncharacterized membrane protein